MKSKDVGTITALLVALGTLAADPAFARAVAELLLAPWPQKIAALAGIIGIVAAFIRARMTPTGGADN